MFYPKGMSLPWSKNREKSQKSLAEQRRPNYGLLDGLSRQVRLIKAELSVIRGDISTLRRDINRLDRRGYRDEAGSLKGRQTAAMESLTAAAAGAGAKGYLDDPPSRGNFDLLFRERL